MSTAARSKNAVAHRGVTAIDCVTCVQDVDDTLASDDTGRWTPRWPEAGDQAA